MLTMVNAAPVQEEQKNLQGLLDALADQKTPMEPVAQAANLIKQQQDDDGSQEAEAQFIGGLLKSLWANKQQNYDGNEAEAQMLGKLLRHAIGFWANKQQSYDGNEAEAQFIGRLLKNVANVQQGQYYDDTADAQFGWGSIFKLFAPHAIKYLGKKLGWALEMEQLGSWMNKLMN